jgi:hypothetical protein
MRGEVGVQGGRKDLERLGDEITELAAHIHAATCRWLRLVAEFDAREGWAPWACKSCAHWISWRCAIAPGAAREHVRVARALEGLPLIAGAFARGELSYSKVRALTRVGGVTQEQELLELARSSTAAQLERIVRGLRRVTSADAVRAHDERFLRVTHDDEGAVLLRGRLSREEGAVVMKALELMRDEAGVSAETPPTAEARAADALVAVADAALAVAAVQGSRSGGDRFQVVVHVDADTLTGDGMNAAGAALDDDAPLATETVRRLCCDAAIVPLLEVDGKPLNVGRKTRSIPPATRRALRRRDAGCRFPGCTQRRHVDAHHIHHWADGGATALGNLVELCRQHHRLVHEAGYRVEHRAGGELAFRRPDGRLISPVPAPDRGDHHALRRDARRIGLRVSAETCVPRWYGDRLDLSSAVDAVLAATAQGERDQRTEPTSASPVGLRT